MKRNLFNLSHTRLLSFRMGQLVPIGLVEVLPGDTFQHATSALIRTQQLLAPVMHPVMVKIHHWFVPNRLLWLKWEDFITGGPTNSFTGTYPSIVAAIGDYSNSTLADYFGLPQAIAQQQSVNSLPFRAYARIWNDHYRDQDLQTPLVSSTADGPDTTTNKLLQNVCWEKDYFTTARPWEAKGPTITVPIGTEAAVAAKRTDTNNAMEAARTGPVPAGVVGNTIQRLSDGQTWQAGLPLVANLSTASAVTVTSLRQSLALQRYAENRARYGSRYTEYLAALGVKSSDARLQRPEYLGGGKQIIQFSEVLQTGTQFDSNLGVGTMRGHGIGALRSNRYRRYFEEHGFVISLMSVVPRTMYINGIHKMWSKFTKESYFQKELQFIGQEPVLNKEIYAANPNGLGTFGYQDRYDDYRRIESGVSGEFKTTLLDYWHFARSFATAPALNASFVSAVPTERVFPAPSTHTVYAMVKHSLRARRIVAKHGISVTM